MCIHLQQYLALATSILGNPPSMSSWPASWPAWEALAPHTCWAVKTGRSVVRQRLANMQETYLSRVPNKVGVADFRSAPTAGIEVLDVLALLPPGARSPESRPATGAAWWTLSQLDAELASDGESGWELDRLKDIPAFLALWDRFPRCQWFLLVDDDTWVNLPSLAQLLAPRTPMGAHYLGNLRVLTGESCEGLEVADQVLRTWPPIALRTWPSQPLTGTHHPREVPCSTVRVRSSRLRMAGRGSSSRAARCSSSSLAPPPACGRTAGAGRATACWASASAS